MSKIVSGILFFITTLCIAQSQRFYYDYKFVPNKEQKEDVKEEVTVLETSEHGSQFFSDTVAKSDITMKKDMEYQLKTTGQIKINTDLQKGLVRYQVSKTYPNFKVFLHTRLGTDRYKVEEDRSLDWKINNEKSVIGEWNVQKAELDFAGRKWTAWFTTDIPIQDGPYKFHGLPGLIVKIEDETQSHKFELKGVEKIEVFSDYFSKLKEITINQKQYAKALSDYEKDPTKGLKQMQMGGITMIMEGGNSGYVKKQEEQLKSKILKDNNRIELNLIK